MGDIYGVVVVFFGGVAISFLVHYTNFIQMLSWVGNPIGVVRK